MSFSQELVLAVPRTVFAELGSFQGFRPDDGTLVDAMLAGGKARFVERIKAEHDPSYKQLIPYVVMRWKDSFLYYVRGRSSGEKRLAQLGSVGIGGHVSVGDRTFFERDLREAFYRGLEREVAEEVDVRCEYSEKVAGLVNDDSNPVGEVHLGVLVIWELAEPEVTKRERSITSLEFLGLEELGKCRDNLETWSQIVIDNAPF